jgi:Ca2+-binding RTX toxin-like protein
VVTVSGLGADITISDFDTNDRLVINGLGGDDVIEASGLTDLQLTADGGDGDDVLVGSHGNDTLLGGNGDDVLLGNGGQDVLDGGPGSNTVIQGAVNQPPAPMLAGNGSAPASDGAHAPNPALLSQFMASSFVTAGDGHGATPVADQPSNQPPLLAQPHT